MIILLLTFTIKNAVGNIQKKKLIVVHLKQEDQKLTKSEVLSTVSEVFTIFTEGIQPSVQRRRMEEPCLLPAPRVLGPPARPYQWVGADLPVVRTGQQVEQVWPAPAEQCQPLLVPQAPVLGGQEAGVQGHHGLQPRL